MYKYMLMILYSILLMNLFISLSKNPIQDFGLAFDHIPIKCDNINAISLSMNHIQHSRTKHIEVRHHFLRDHMMKGDIALEFVSTEHQLAYIFIKLLSKDRFCEIMRNLGLFCMKHMFCRKFMTMQI